MFFVSDRKFQGEICQFEGRDLPILSMKIAVKLCAFIKPLIISLLQKGQKHVGFVNIFYHFSGHFQGPFNKTSVMSTDAVLQVLPTEFRGA